MYCAEGLPRPRHVARLESQVEVHPVRGAGDVATGQFGDLRQPVPQCVDMYEERGSGRAELAVVREERPQRRFQLAVAQSVVLAERSEDTVGEPLQRSDVLEPEQ